MKPIAITIEIDPAGLAGCSDETLATYWHVAQANPADGFEHSAPGELVERIGREIIRRWLATVPPELWHHQDRHYYWHWLRKFATYRPGYPDWLEGQWVPRTEDEP
jgi:hypothetical protein